MNKKSYPDNNPKTVFGAQKLPLDLVPPALEAYAAKAFADGARKYGPYNWRTAQISSSVYYAAVKRHLAAWWDGEDLAPDSGIPHLAHAIACLGMLADASGTPMLNDNRPPSGPAARLHAGYVRSGYDTGREGKGSGQEAAEGDGRVLSHARAKRARKSRA